MPHSNAHVSPPSRSSSFPLTGDHGSAPSSNAALERDRALAAIFNDDVDEAMKIPDTYDKVAVLLIHWAKELDDMKCEQEVEQLDSLFKYGYIYETKRLELNLDKNPQHQLKNGIGNFVEANDGEFNLLIIYYAGHGVFDVDLRVLYLDATNKIQPPHRGPYQARACWHVAEDCHLKEDIHADVLAILDCCFAGDVRSTSGRNNRSYELLSANGPGETTPGPGPHSFTSSLIAELKEVANNPDGNRINTFDLCARIAKRRHNQYQPRLCRRFGGLESKHIRLSPRSERSQAPSQEARQRRAPVPAQAWDFSLQFTLEAPPTDEQIRRLAKMIPSVFRESELQLYRVRWVVSGFNTAASIFIKLLGRKQREGHHRQNGGGDRLSPEIVVNEAALIPALVEPRNLAVSKKINGSRPWLLQPWWLAAGFSLVMMLGCFQVVLALPWRIE